MGDTSSTGYGGAARWNGASGQAWVQTQALMDAMYRPLEELLVEAVSARRPRSVLDVGCGTGATTVAVAARLGEGSRCCGVDISEPMVAAARARGGAATFLRADVQEHAWAAGEFDAVMSRFGVMFFDDPVRAFGNLRGGATDDASLVFVAWRDIEENPFMTAAERAAGHLLPDMPPRRPDGPGQFGFADRDKVHGILAEAGWTGISIEPIDVTCAFGEEDLVGYFTRLGPVGLALPGVDDATRERVIDTVRPAFAPFVHGPEVRFTAACWLVKAHSTGQ
ncbi:class I SAM-dependent methyltransferase [Actinoplanes sp. LDG1-06]|uniref:Class I SAM-dependent methyltransferase n=1 Tax=Paractinoplanes ovalisporus TaxID=2810368 RepID=A0ABS2AKB3_9ACTN|nr:class I SAM-dependent methyltransferase [Actinoplanes ovalisporus]MBM2620295.1 class I SAM-dependent methyltransferase [Actinoplanes ovalisporus]